MKQMTCKWKRRKDGTMIMKWKKRKVRPLSIDERGDKVVPPV